jgi:hypothetical protein
MARRHGRNSRLYVDLSGAGSAAPVPFLSGVDLSFVTDQQDVTAFGDTTKVYVAGLPDASGSYSGWYDDGTDQLFTAALDGVARKTYFYPDISNAAGEYFFGTAFFDFATSTGVADALSISGSITAASSFAKVSG